jgi:hypothetical protein
LTQSYYTIKPGDKPGEVARQGCVHAGQHVGYCAVCDLYQHVNNRWSRRKGPAGEIAACELHNPMDVELWYQEYWGDA